MGRNFHRVRLRRLLSEVDLVLVFVGKGDQGCSRGERGVMRAKRNKG